MLEHVHVCLFVHKKSWQQNPKKVKLICVDGARIKYSITIHVYLNTFLGMIHVCMAPYVYMYRLLCYHTLTLWYMHI